ncbi:uncharacterized protein NPIL_600451 [Nephila pilipes]|uniref:BRCA1-associated ATM activator 1 n=1 Tax=Nephila pilipes TaxID=299642 RepID=A0A8X6P1V3_NEPPI|nr:uncharacterized protein NPIL_600451 [Nephila pilipes]
MSSKEVYESLNKVFDLMLDGKFRDDMDDSLLQKLLTVLANKFSSYNFRHKHSRNEDLSIVKNFILNTQALQFAEKAILSLTSKSTELSVSILSFALELIGMVFSYQDIFISHEDSKILKEFSNAVHKMSVLTCPLSIQLSILHCLTDLIKHPKGILWLNDQDLIHFAFSCFSSSSYYVRREACSFFERALFMWESSEISTLSMEEQSTLDNILGNIVSNLIAEIKVDDLVRDDNKDFCFLTLKHCFKISNVRQLIDTSSDLKLQLLNYFQCLKTEESVNLKTLEFIAAVFSSDGASEFFARDILNSLISHSMFSSAITLLGLILRKHIQLLIMPLQILSGSFSFREEDDIFALALIKVYGSMTKAIEVRSDCIKIIISCLLSLAQVTEFMDSEALETMVVSIRIVATGPTSFQDHPMSYLCLENRKICLALIELFSIILKEKVYPNLKLQNKLDLLNCLLHYIEKPCDCNICAEALKLLSNMIALNDKDCVSLPDELKEKTADLLCKKLMDKAESIVIETLSVVGAIINRDGNQFWKEIILKKNIHQIVWEMGVDGIQTEMLKAASLRTNFQVCKMPYFWEDIKSAKRVNEVDVLNILIHYYHVYSCFVQIESLNCISELLADDKLPESCLDSVFTVLLKAMQSLDMEHKITALDTWSGLIKSSKFFPETMHSVDNLLNAVCNSGFAAALVLAIEDYNKSVQYKAAEILKKFQEILLQMGYTKDFVALDDVEELVPVKINHVEEFCFSPISKEEKDAAIENVMNITTAEQIAMLTLASSSPLSDNSLEDNILQVEKLSYPVNSFLKCVWSDKVNHLLSEPDSSQDLFSEYTVSLLDDIIASEITEIRRPLDDVPDCY